MTPAQTMRFVRSSVPMPLLFLLHHVSGLAATPPCDVSDPTFVCGLHNPEDLIRLQGTHWVVASAVNFKMGGTLPYDFGPGPLSAIRIDTHTVQLLYPTAESAVDWDSRTYPDCSTPPAIFSSHGLNSRSLSHGKYRLYAVNHGSRESIEVIDVAVQGARLQTTWRGCIPVSVRELRIWPNAVAPLPDGGLALAGYNVALWRPGRGWEKFQSYDGMTPGERGGAGFANGVEVSRDGRWIFVADTQRNSVIRIPIKGGEQTVFKLTFTPDNIRWGEDGLLYVAGPIWPKWEHPDDDARKCFEQPICVTGIGVASIDPQTLVFEDVLHNEQGIKDKFGTPTTALQMGSHLWISTSRGDRVMIVGLTPE
jgi:hypothetical protein